MYALYGHPRYFKFKEKYQQYGPCFQTIIPFLMTRNKPIVVYRGENAAYEFIKAILKEYKYCKKVINKHFNKNLIMSEKEEHLFKQSNSCCICKKLIDNEEQKVRDHCHMK